MINLPQYHLVVQPAQDAITFHAYLPTHHLTVTLTHHELSTIKWFQADCFDSPLDFYHYLKQNPRYVAIDTDSHELVLTAKIG